MKRQHSIDQTRLEQSSEWIERLRRGNAADDEEFARWLLASKENVHDFLLMSAIDEELRHFDVERHIAVEGVVHTPVQEAAKPRPRWTSSWWALTAAAAVVAFVLIGPGALRPFIHSSEWREYQTRIGEQSIVTLPDGSKVKLNAQSRISARVSRGLRDVKLVEGEAFFNIAKDVARPFSVNVGSTSLVVKGTRFNADRREDGDVTVAVLEGRVEVESDTVVSSIRKRIGMGVKSTPLEKGQQARVGSAGAVQLEPAADAEATASWSTGTFRFANKNFREMVDEFNRFNTTQIHVVGSPSGAERRRDFRFPANDPKGFATFVGSANGWKIEEDAQGNIVVSDVRGTGKQ